MRLEEERRKAPTFSPDLKAELVEARRLKALELQAACREVARLREELQELEEMVWVVTGLRSQE